MGRASDKGEVRYEPVLYRPVRDADAIAKFQGQGRRNRDGVRQLLVIVGRDDFFRGVADRLDDIAGLEITHLVDDAAGFARLLLQYPGGKILQVEPRRHGES